MNYDLNFRYPNSQEIAWFFDNKQDGLTLRCPSNSNRFSMRIMAKWTGDVITAKYNAAYADVLDVLYAEAKRRNITVHKSTKPMLTKSDLTLGQTLGELGF